MIALIVIGCIILYFLIGFAIHVVFSILDDVYDLSYDFASGFMMFTWPIAAIVYMAFCLSGALDQVTRRICRFIRNKRK